MRAKMLAVLLLAAFLLLAVPPSARAAPQASVSGVVTGPDGGVGGATVKVETIGRGGLPRTVATVVTSADGGWAYAGKTADYRFTFSSEGFVERVETLTMANKGDYTLDVSLTPEAPPSGTISGRILGATGTGMHGFVYFYRQNADGTWPTTYAYDVETAADGAYSSPALPLGSYKVRLFTVHTGVQWYRYVATEELATPVVLDTPGQVVTGIDAQYPPPAP